MVCESDSFEEIVDTFGLSFAQSLLYVGGVVEDASN